MLILLLVLAGTSLLWWYLTLRKYKSLDEIPGPSPLPFIGNSLDIGNSPQDFLRNTLKFRKVFGHIFKFYVGSELKVYIASPELLEEILTSTVHITKSHSYDFLKPWLEEGLIMSSGSKWKSRRKLITPTFHFKILDQFLKIFNSAGNILAKKLSNEVGKQSCDIFPFVNLCSLDVICETSMGVEMKAQENQHTEYVEAVKTYLDIFIERVFSAWKRVNVLFWFSPNYTTYKNSLKSLHDFTNNVIAKRREEKSKEKSSISAEISHDGIKRKVALLDMLLESENNDLLSNEDIREEIDNFMFAGHDTTTAGISFTILALAENPKVQEKLFEEIQSVMGTDENITMQHLQEAKYLDMVVKETLRIYPPVPSVERKLENNARIGGYEFPKGTTLSVYIYGLHHSEKYFSDLSGGPEKFIPERFLPENQAQRHTFSYVPFSAGPRNCIGQKFAMLGMKTIIIKIIRTFRILPVKNYKPDLGMSGILKSFNGIQVQLELRNKSIEKIL